MNQGLHLRSSSRRKRNYSSYFQALHGMICIFVIRLQLDRYYYYTLYLYILSQLVHRSDYNELNRFVISQAERVQYDLKLKLLIFRKLDLVVKLQGCLLILIKVSGGSTSLLHIICILRVSCLYFIYRYLRHFYLYLISYTVVMFLFDIYIIIMGSRCRWTNTPIVDVDIMCLSIINDNCIFVGGDDHIFRHELDDLNNLQ